MNEVKQVKRTLPDSRLIVVGPGIRGRKKYRKQVAHDRIEDITFVGFTTYNDLPRYYKTADIVCCPATGWESFGIVLIEAMAVGTPVVASNISGYTSVLTNDAEGLLVPPKNATELAKALLTLADDTSRRQRMGKQGIATAQRYSWDNVAKNVLACYHKILS